VIDTGIGPTWQAALAPDNRSLRFCTTEELNAPFALEAIQRWWGCDMATARDARGAELRRRTMTTDYPMGAK
jgi:hypothetical protein